MTQHNVNETTLESNFNRWLDSQTSEESQGQTLTEQELIELQMHPVWSERMLAFSSFNHLAEQSELNTEPVPKWNRDAGFEQNLQTPSWWQQQSMSLVALTFSIFACVVMLFDLRVSVTDGGVNIATADYLQKQQLEQEFASLAQQNNDLIQTRLDNFQASQQQSTAQLVSYVLNNSRLERKEDIQDVVEVIQQQRKDDLLYLKQQFNDISYQMRKTQFSPRQGSSDKNVSLNDRDSFITE